MDTFVISLGFVARCRQSVPAKGTLDGNKLRPMHGCDDRDLGLDV